MRHVEHSQPSFATQMQTCGARSVGEVEKSVADQQESQKVRMRLEKVLEVPKKSDLTMQVCGGLVSVVERGSGWMGYFANGHRADDTSFDVVPFDVTLFGTYVSCEAYELFPVGG